MLAYGDLRFGCAQHDRPGASDRKTDHSPGQNRPAELSSGPAVFPSNLLPCDPVGRIRQTILITPNPNRNGKQSN